MSRVEYPEDGKILQKWARDIVDELRRRRLVSNEYFDIRVDENGTVIRLITKTKKTRYRIHIEGGLVSRSYYSVVADKGMDYDMNGSMKMRILPQGFTTVQTTETPVYKMPAGDLVDGGPYYPGEGMITYNTVCDVIIEVEEIV